MKTRTFDVYADPGHAWAKVKIDYLKKLGIAHEISPYSYSRGEYAYLEEDCDLSVLVKACRKIGIEPKFKERYSNKSSKIRSYYSYKAS